jgi:hypothetical protein
MGGGVKLANRILEQASKLKDKLSQAAHNNTSIKEDVKSIQERLENIEAILLDA